MTARVPCFCQVSEAEKQKIRYVRFGCWFFRRETLFVREVPYTNPSNGGVIQERGNMPGVEGNVKVRSNWWNEPHVARRPATDVPTFRRPTVRGVNPRASVLSAFQYASVRHQGLRQLVPCQLWPTAGLWHSQTLNRGNRVCREGVRGSGDKTSLILNLRSGQ